MRRTAPAALVLATVLLLAGACGNDDDDAADTTVAAVETTEAATETTETATETTAAASGRTLDVTASEPAAGSYAFDGVPSELAGGVVTVNFTNGGGEPHELAFVQITGEHTVDEFVAQVVETEGGPIPDWVGGITGVGPTPPTGSTTASITLDEGSYLFFCAITDQNDVPHAKNGMAGTLTVSGDEGGELPATDAKITIRDYAFDVTGLSAGSNTVTVENTGEQYHHVLFLPAVGDATLDDFKAFMAADAGGPPTETTAAGAAPETTAAQGPPPVDFEKQVGSTVLGPGESYVTTMDLPAGRYFALCFIQDKAGGPPHVVAHDMLQEVTIS